MDAERLLEEWGPAAYEHARTKARKERQERLDRHLPEDHWDRVRAIIAKRVGRDYVDTATRYLAS